MSKDELWNVLKFIKKHGVILESTVWKEFVVSESKHEQVRVKWLIEDLQHKGLIKRDHNDQGDCFVTYARLDVQ